MLLPGQRLINIPILGLQTGSKLGFTKSAIIDPSNLKIIAFEIDGPLLTEKPSYLVVSDIRELSDIGMIIDSNDEFVGIDDVIQLRKIIDLNFKLIGMPVIDENKRKLGRVNDYNVETSSFLVQQLNTKQSLIKSIASTGLLINRRQIVEINNQNIIVRSAMRKLESIKQPDKLDYINPFRSTPAHSESNRLKNS